MQSLLIKDTTREERLGCNFYEVHSKWRSGKISVSQAAKECGLPQSKFFRKAKEFEGKNPKIWNFGMVKKVPKRIHCKMRWLMDE